MNLRAERGQGTVELALGSLLFITILLFGIHFAEVGMMKLRVQQAANSALWDTTQWRKHNYRTKTPKFFNANQIVDPKGRQPDTRATDYYQDFEGENEGGGKTFTQVMTRGASLSVNCTPRAVAAMKNNTVYDRIKVSFDDAKYNGKAVDGMVCNSEAVLEPWMMPKSFFEKKDGGFFKAKNVEVAKIHVCAFGRYQKGSCQAGVELALDDWGLSGSDNKFGNETDECDKKCLFTGKNQKPSGNQAYLKTINRLYDKYASVIPNNTYIPDFIREIFTQSPSYPALDNVPVDERTFRMVFTGEDKGHSTQGELQHTNPFRINTREQDTYTAFDYDTSGHPGWAVTPFSTNYKSAYKNRGECFAGTSCKKSPFDK